MNRHEAMSLYQELRELCDAMPTIEVKTRAEAIASRFHHAPDPTSLVAKADLVADGIGEQDVVQRLERLRQAIDGCWPAEG